MQNPSAPPPARLIALTEFEAVFEARLPKRPLVALTTVGVIATLVVLIFAVVTRSQAGLLGAILLVCTNAFTVTLAIAVVRSVYRVRFDFQSDRVTVTDRRGLSETSEWAGHFLEIGDVVPTQNGLSIVWEGGEPGPILVMPKDEANRFRERLARA